MKGKRDSYLLQSQPFSEKIIIYTVYKNNVRILILESHKDTAISYKNILEKRTHTVTLVDNSEDCLKLYSEELQNIRISGISQTKNPFDIVMLDYMTPKTNYIDLIEEILAINPHQRILFLFSADVRKTLVNSASQLKQVVELLQKPFDIQSLVDIVEDKYIHEELEKFNINVVVFQKEADMTVIEFPKVKDSKIGELKQNIITSFKKAEK
jgi:CheY-like chemotaxis protein